MSNTIWVSHSSLSDFENCPRLYYLKNIYRNPKNGYRLQIVNPYLSLGSAVHNVLESLTELTIPARKRVSWLNKFKKEWIGGKLGGFGNSEKEKLFYNRGVKMIKSAEASSFLFRQSYRWPANTLPKMTIFPDVELVGSLDWAEILPDGSLHIVDFKTGNKEEKGDSLQLPIYRILAEHNYEPSVSKLSYWYLEKDSDPQMKEVPDQETCLSLIKERAEVMVEAIRSNNFTCNSNYRSCFKCRDYESVLSGRAEYLGSNDERKKDLYYLPNGAETVTKVMESLSENQQKVFYLRLEGLSIEEIYEKTKLNIKTISEEIRQKAKDVLSPKELKLFVAEMGKNNER